MDTVRPILTVMLVASVSAGILACAAASAPAAGGASDASVIDAASLNDAASPCTLTDAGAICQGRSTNVAGDADTRPVYWAEPAGDSVAPRPAVVLYQGSGIGPATTWNVEIPVSAPYGGYYQLAVIAALVDHGFVVIQPAAQGGLVWDTNNPLADYDASADAVFIPRLLDAIAGGTFGPVDMKRLYATGISSGGYMTSRMAVSYQGRFRALAIESASYATCLGPLCTIPALPAAHPPTLLLHGGADSIVPIATARDYYDALVAAGVEARFVEEADAGHQWLPEAPAEILTWFTSH